MKILAFPYAFGSANIYFEFKNTLGSRFDLQSFDYPGHGIRLGEDTITSISGLADDALKQIIGLINEPYCLMGYSMGGLVVFELYKKLKARNLPLPEHIFMLGTCEPSHKFQKGDFENYDLEGVKDILRKRNGTSEEILAEDELIELIAPGVKADSIALRDYSCDADSSAAIECGATVVRGSREKDTNKCHKEWEKYLHRSIDYHTVEGDHFFLFKEGEKMRAQISDIVSAAVN